MGRKSRGRGTRRPIWEVQCKQSPFLIIPAHVRNWTHFDVLPQRPLRPPIPCSQTAVLRASQGNVQIAASESGGPREGRGGIQYLVGHWEGDERMWSGAELTGVQSIAWRALIIADAFKGALEGKFNISKHKDPKIQQQEEKKVKMAFMMSFNWAQYSLKDKLKILLSTDASGQMTIVSSSKVSQKPLHFCFGSQCKLHFGNGERVKIPQHLCLSK